MVVPFGRNGCSPIKEEQFRKICDFAKPAGTVPLVFEVPVPSFAQPVPPAECACFDFKSGSSKVNVITDAARQKLAKASVEIRQRDPDCCTGRYEIIPLVEIPACTLADTQNLCTKKVELDDRGSYIQATLTRQNCDIGLALSGRVNHPMFPQPCIPTIETQEFTLHVTYKDKDGKPVTVDPPATFKVMDTAGSGGCPRYAISDATLEFGAIGGGVGSGGPVFPHGDSNNLFVDGKASAAHAWYCGGYGDIKDTHPDATRRRGNKMRGVIAPTRHGYVPVPVATIDQPYIVRDDVEETVTETTLAETWTSTWRPDESGDPLVAMGDLSVIMPTGAQWHDKGMALTLSEFIFTQDGILSQVGEKTTALIIPAGPSQAQIQTSPDSFTEKDASGLITHGDIEARTVDGVTYPARKAGMSINAGDGLRICGTDERTNPSDSYRSEARFGELEIQYGGGLHVLQGYDPSTGAPVFDEWQSDEPGALSVSCGDGIRLDAQGRVALDPDNDAFAKKTHDHGFITSQGELKWGSTGVEQLQKWKIPITDADGKIAWTAHGPVQLTVPNMLAVLHMADGGIGGVSDFPSAVDPYVKKLTLGGQNSTDSGIVIDGANGQVQVSSHASLATIELGGTNVSTVVHNDAGTLTFTGGQVVIKSVAVGKDTELGGPPSATAGQPNSLAVATCGWVSSNFMLTSGFTPDRWVITDKDGHLATMDNGDTGVLYANSGARQILPIGAVDEKAGVGIAGLTVIDESGVAVVPPENIPFGDGEEDRVATGNHVHGKLQNDGTVDNSQDSLSASGDLLVRDAGQGELRQFRGFTQDWVAGLELRSATQALASMADVFALDATGTELRVPTSRLTFDSGEEHDNNCLLMVDSDGDVHHSGNAMYDTLEVLSTPKANESTAPVAYTGGGGSSPVYSGLTRAAFGGYGTTEAATVVFEKAENGRGAVATLLDGMPVTAPSDKEGVVYDNEGEVVIASSGTGIKVDVTQGSGDTPSTAELEVNFGRGLHATSCSGTAEGNNDKLELNVDDTDFAFLAESSSTPSVTAAQLAVNDEDPNIWPVLMVPFIGPGASEHKWSRRTGEVGGTSPTKKGEVIVRFVSDMVDDELRYGYLRFLRNGVLLGVYFDSNGIKNNNIEMVPFDRTSQTHTHVTACETPIRSAGSRELTSPSRT